MGTEDINTLFSKNLLYWLDKRGKTQADLYKRLDVSSATASDWCNSKKMPKADKLVQIAEWLMIELSDLLCDKEKIEPSEEDKLFFRIKDDKAFRNLAFELNGLSSEQLEHVSKCIYLLKK